MTALTTSPALPSTAKRPLLSLKTPGEILAANFPAGHFFFDNRLWGRGLPLGVIGPPGIGKSRLVLQLVVSAVCQAPYLGLPCTWPSLRFLFLQAENSTARLQQDLLSLKTALTVQEWERFLRQVHFHTIETHLDSALNLSDHGNVSNIAELIKAVAADVVIFDPLDPFAPGSLNSDSVMRTTLEQLSRLAKLGNPQAATIFVHHALTGTAGKSKATGFDRVGYAKGSKSFAAFLRGQINVFPRSSDDNTRLIVACGKNSNGPEFQPIGIVLNPATMLYDLDPEFDLAEWKDSQHTRPSSRTAVKPEDVATLVQHLPMKRKALVKELMDEFGCQKSAAYSAIDAALGKTIRFTDEKTIEAIPEVLEPADMPRPEA